MSRSITVSPRTVVLAVALATGFGLFTPSPADALRAYDEERPRADPVVSDAVSARLAGTQAVPVWIAFTDKGVDAESRLATPADFLSPRAIERRAVRGNGVRLADVPLQEAYVAAVDRAGAVIRQRSRWFNAVSAWATPADLLRIAQLPFVAEITPIRGVLERRDVDLGDVEPASGRAGDPLDRAFYGFDPIPYERTQIIDVHRNGYTGAGVLIAVFDSGFYADHPAFRDIPLVDERDFVQGDRDTADDPTGTPPDMTSFFGNANMCHGTATWSIAGGYMPGKRVGVAFGAEFAIAKTEYPQYERHVEEDNWAAAAEWADSLGADIITSSLGYTTFDTGEDDYTYTDLDGVTTIVAQAANLADANGILIVNSAGNGGPEAKSINSPSDSNSVLAVGAVHPNSEVVTDFSSRGPVAPTPPDVAERIKPDVLAQGARVPSATSEGCYDPTAGGGFSPYDDDGDPWYDLEDVQGTSFSCPMTAGAAALVLEAHPLWRPHEMRHVLRQTADDCAVGITPSTTRGCGVIRVADAIAFTAFGFALPPLRPGPFDVTEPEAFNVANQPVAMHPPTFAWTESARARTLTPITYTVELDDDPAFDSPESWSGISDLFLTLADDPAEGFYYWRVVASDATTYTRESRQRSRILIDFPPEAAPLETPIADAVIDVLTPTFTWTASVDPSPDEELTYRVHVEPIGQNTIVYPFISETTFTVPAEDPVHELRNHRWWVETRDRFGVSVTSVPRPFSVGAFPPLAFTLLGPADDGEVSTRRPTLTWNATVDLNPDDHVAYDVYWGDSPSTMTRRVQDLNDPEIRVPSSDRFDDADVVFWQVHAVDDFGNETLSDVRSFRVELAPLPFALVEPGEDDTLILSRPDFSWEEPDDESTDDSFTYTVAVYADLALTDLVAEQSGITETSVRFEPSLPDEMQLWWRVKATDEQGHETWSTARSFITSAAPAAFVAESFPNPFSPTTHPFTVRYGVPVDSDGSELRIRVFDGAGRVVRTLQKGTARAGTDFVVSWDGRSDDGTKLSAGMYFVSVQVGGNEQVEKIILLGR